MEDGLIVEEGQRVKAHSFKDMIEQSQSGYYTNNEYRPDVLYYICCLGCALFVLLGALVKISGYCASFSVLGMLILVYLIYEYADHGWIIGISKAYFTFGFAITCIGFLAVLIASLWDSGNRDADKDSNNNQ